MQTSEGGRKSIPLLVFSWCYAQVAKSPNGHQGADIRCKSKRVFITKLELGLPPILTQRLQGGVPGFGLHCLYREYTWKEGFLGRGKSHQSLSFEGLCVGSPLVPIVKVDKKFLSIKSGDFGLESDWLVGSGVNQGISKGSFPRTLQNGVFLLTKCSSLDSSLDISLGRISQIIQN